MTGLGLLTGLGADATSTWSAIRAGRCAVRELDGFPTDRPPLGCVVPLADGMLRSRTADHALRLLDLAAHQARADAKLVLGDVDPTRAAVLVGLSKGGVQSLGRLHRMVRDSAANPELAAILWRQSWPSSGASRLSARLGWQGPCSAPIAACATGLVAVLQAADLIRRGECDVALAGSADASLDPMLMAAFGSMKVLSRWEGEPAGAVRPWDRDRSGFVVGEGAAVLLLERGDMARARGARPYAELCGGALGSDAFHETNLNPDPSNLAALIGRALQAAGVEASEVDHINVHGTATRPNDPLECRAIRLALGKNAGDASCSANKAQIGHLLGAAGSAELALTCLAIREGFAPPTLNLDNPDPACDLDGTPGVGRAREIRAAIKLSLGFGGHLAAAVLRRPEG